MSLTAAIDLGTTSVRAVLYDQEGNKVSQAQSPLSLMFPKTGWVEQDPIHYLTQTELVLKQAVADSGRPIAEVSSIGVVSQRGTALAWDATSGQPLAPAISWQDRRTLERVREIQALGLPLNTMAGCTKFEWFMQNSPEVQEAARHGSLRMGTPDAWLTWWLTGGRAFVTDPSNAGSTALFFPDPNQPDSSWSSDAMDFFQQDPNHHPSIVASSEIVDETSRQGLGATIPVASRVGDQQAACYGHGIAQAGQSKLSLGTSAMFNVCTGQTLEQAPGGSYALPLWRLPPDPTSGAVGEETISESYCLEGTVMAAGSTVEWLVRVGLLDEVASLDAIAGAATSRSERSPLLIPGLAGLGTPYMNDRVQGSILGIDLSTTQADIVAGAIEGIAQRCAQVVRTLQPTGPQHAEVLTDDREPIFIDGGLSQSQLLLQRIADLTGRTLTPSPDLETAARGGAMLAARAVGGRLPLLDPGPLLTPELNDQDRESACTDFTQRMDGSPQGI